MKYSALLLLFLIFIETCSCYKILVYSNLFGHSHVKMLGTVADLLTDAGHNVTIVMPIIDEKERGKYGVKSTKRIILVEPTDDVRQKMNYFGDVMQKDIWDIKKRKNPLAIISASRSFAEMFGKQCDNVLSSTELLEQIKAENYDLAIGEPFDLCGYAFFEAINIRAHVAVLSTTRFDHVSWALGQPMATSYVPGALSSFTEKMTITERVVNNLLTYAGYYMFSFIGDYEYESARKIVNINRSWREVLPEASFVFTNQIPILDFPAPTFDKIVPIGGITVNMKMAEMKLPAKWDKVLGLRKQNVFVSFGSNAKSIDMPDSLKQSILRVFESMPDVTFIWKYENEKETLADHLDNVYLGSWLPQNELLADSRLNVFVTHGGLASTWELSHLGKPCVMIPLFADQNRNAAMLKRHGGAEVLKKEDLDNSQLIADTIKKVLNNPDYRKNAESLAEKLNNLPTNAREILVKHVEFVARVGKLPTLDNHGRQMSMFTYYLLDVLLIVGLVALLVLYVFYRFVRFTIRKCFGGSVKPKHD